MFVWMNLNSPGRRVKMDFIEAHASLNLQTRVYELFQHFSHMLEIWFPPSFLLLVWKRLKKILTYIQFCTYNLYNMTICYMYVSIGIMYMIPAVKKIVDWHWNEFNYICQPWCFCTYSHRDIIIFINSLISLSPTDLISQNGSDLNSYNE